MRVIDRLLNGSKEIWAEYYKHPFVRGIQNGTLDKEKFRYYILQDYLYLIDYARVFGIGLAKAKSQESRNLFSAYLRSLSEFEMDIHRGYMGKFAITKEDIAAEKISLANLSYTSYMLRVAYEEGEAEALAAVLSCAISYEYIAKHMVKENPESLNHPFYGEWVAGYAGEDYHQENAELIEMLEKLTENYSEEQIQHLIEIFRVSSRYELEFWNMAWNMNK